MTSSNVTAPPYAKDLKELSPFLGCIKGSATMCHTGEEAAEVVAYIYEKNKQLLRDSVALLEKKKGSAPVQRDATYPYIGISVEPHQLNVDATKAHGIALEPGHYGTTVTRPDLFGTYYKEQIDHLIQHHGVPVMVGESTWPMPLPFVDEETLLSLTPETLWDLSNNIPLPNLERLDDSIANGTYPLNGKTPRPLALFTAERVDYSLQRLHHYCGTDARHFQHFILLTNYQRYIDYFIEHALKEIEQNEEMTLVLPGDHVLKKGMDLQAEMKKYREHHLSQMPAYHLTRPDGHGITFVNIGVGPTNAKNITDHLAVLRPHCWIMLGHCAGFRRSQQLGDYVLAHGYVREDHVLDKDVPLWMPIPSIVEMQLVLQEAVVNVTGLKGNDVRNRLRTGTVISSDNRNWEIGGPEMFAHYNRTRAIALDMESASLATNGFRFRVPYATLLCVSDKPLHGELKLKGMATQFYKERVKQHVHIGLRAVEILREKGTAFLHSRKLRGFDEPPFR